MYEIKALKKLMVVGFPFFFLVVIPFYLQGMSDYQAEKEVFSVEVANTLAENDLSRAPLKALSHEPEYQINDGFFWMLLLLIEPLTTPPHEKQAVTYQALASIVSDHELYLFMQHADQLVHPDARKLPSAPGRTLPGRYEPVTRELPFNPLFKQAWDQCFEALKHRYDTYRQVYWLVHYRSESPGQCRILLQHAKTGPGIDTPG